MEDKDMQMIVGMFESLITKIDNLEKGQLELKQDVTKVQITLENDVSKRLDSLFDGYQLNHEKQWEFEHRLTQLERRLETLEHVG